jgi:hypothetical protein
LTHSAPSTSGEHIASPTSFDQLQQRPRFEASVDPKQHRLTEVLTDYTFEKEVPCGLSTCKQGHLKGFLVCTQSGVETNIGHVCGKRHFGEDFDVASARFSRSKEYRDAMERVQVLKEQAPAVIGQVQALIGAAYGIRWVYALREALRERVGHEAYDHLQTRAYRDEYEVTRVEELSEDEIRRIMRERGVRREKVQYRTEPVGRLSPMGWLLWDFRSELFNSVTEPFAAIRDLDPTGRDAKALQRLLRPLAGWESRIHMSQQHLDDARRFLNPDNFSLADVAIDEFYKSTRGPREYRTLTEWRTSAAFAGLAAGSTLPTATPVAAKPKPLSKGQLRKNKRRGK